jgi:hypothetical protein
VLTAPTKKPRDAVHLERLVFGLRSSIAICGKHLQNPAR